MNNKVISIKRAIIAAATAVVAFNSFGQGYADFQNNVAAKFWFNSVAPSNNISYTTIGSQTGNGSSGVVEVGLYWSTSVFTDPAQGTLADLTTIESTDPFLGMAIPGIIAGNKSLPIAGTSPDELVYVQVFAWDSTFSNPDAAIAAGAYFGAASAGVLNAVYGAIGAPIPVVLAPSGLGQGAEIFGNNGGYSRTLLLQSPEPGTLAIAGLGAMSLLLLRRRK